MTAALPISSGDAALRADEMLALERVDPDHFRSWRNQDNRAGAIFGGQPLAQAMAAAQATVPGWPIHNLTGNFMRPGDFDVAVDYAVERVRDGRRYAARRVLATQAGKAIFDCICSFHDPEESVSHQVGDIAGVPAPETLIDMREFAVKYREAMPAIMARSFSLPFPVEIRMVDPFSTFEPGEEVRRDFWFRMPSAATLSDPGSHHCMIAFGSDYWLAGTAAIPHSQVTAKSGLSVASLNHAMWFHAPARADEWLLHRTDSNWAGSGRGLARGQIYDRAGTLIATTMQEASLRRAAPRN